MKSGLSFKAKLQAILLSVSFTAVLFLVLAAYQSFVAFRSGKEAQLRTSAEGWIDKIDRNLFERYGDVQAFAMSEAARSMNPDRITDFMNDMMLTYAPVYDLMMVTDVEGRILAVSTKDKQGESIRSQSLLGTDVSQKTWFKAAISDKIKPGTSHVDDLHIENELINLLGTSEKVMSFTAPIRDKHSGKIVGVWSNRMSWSDVIEVITREESEKIKSPQITSSFPFLISNQGTFLIHPLGEEYELKKSSQSRLSLDSSEQDVVNKELETAYFNGDVLEVIAKSKGYSSYPGIGWSVMLQIPASDAQTRNNAQMILLAFILIFLANSLAFWLIRRMGGDFERVVKQMTDESSHLTLAANEISTASQQLSQSTTEQAAAIEETASSMEEITAMLGQTTQNASHCRTLSEEGQGEVSKGKEVILKMSSAMEDISAANSKLDRLVSLIEDIKNKTKIINDIVSETRLLSFNASIEAARAGAHGKGFAVVAEEVGKLAAISGKAADEIRDLLDSSRQEVSQVVKETQDKVSVGHSVSRECEIAFTTMGQSLEKVNELIRTIANASKEQEIGIKQTNKAMTEMDKVTQLNARGAEVLSTQAENLHSGAETLNQSISRIRAIVVGTTATPPATASPLSEPAFVKTGFSALSQDARESDRSRPLKSDDVPSRNDSRWKKSA